MDETHNWIREYLEPLGDGGKKGAKQKRPGRETKKDDSEILKPESPSSLWDQLP